jgi:hypothetical protein
MSTDLYLDRNTWDLALTTDKAVREASQGPEVNQRVLIRLKRQLGEWFLNVLLGLPWYPEDGMTEEAILGSRDVQAAELLIRTEILETTGVREMQTFRPLWNNLTRNLNLFVQFASDYGTAETLKTTAGA